jgi:hypothetical protein
VGIKGKIRPGFFGLAPFPAEFSVLDFTDMRLPPIKELWVISDARWLQPVGVNRKYRENKKSS